MRKANENDLKMLNDYIEISGIVYSEDDNIMNCQGALEVAKYLFSDNPSELIRLLNDMSVNDENQTLLENLVDDLGNVIQLENGDYLVIK